MTEFDRASLDRLLPATPGAPDWDDVLSRSRAHETRRHRLAVLAAAALVLVVGTASAFAVRAVLRDDRPDLPPAAAKPSAPASGTLVLSYYREPLTHVVFVYADGRVIWSHGTGPFSAGGIRTGFLEQRLTREGVERLRQSVLSTVPFDRRREATVIATRNLFHGVVQVRTGGRLVTAEWCCPPWVSSPPSPSWVVATRAQTRAIRRLSDLLADPKSALPRSAWKDPKLRAYVPSRYAICPDGSPRDLAWLPSAVRALLRGKARTYQAQAWPLRPYLDPGRRRSFACPELTTREARVLEEILSANGFERHTAPGVTWAKAGTGPHRPGQPRPQLVVFRPVLPHGQLE